MKSFQFIKDLCSLAVVRSMVFLVLIAIGLASCSSDPLAVAPAALPKIKTSLHIKRVWQTQLTASTHFAGYRLEPWIANDQILISDIHGNINMLDAASGHRLWHKKLPFFMGSGLTADQAHIYLSDRQAILYAWSFKDNAIGESSAPAWKKSLSSEVIAPVAVSDDLIAVQTVDGRVYGLDPETGEQLWVYVSELPNLTLRGTSQPQIVSGAVIVGFATGKLVVIDAKTGLPIWEKQLSLSAKGRSEFDQLSDIDGDFVIANSILYVGNYQGQIAALDLFSGQIIWSQEISTYSNLFESSGQLYVCDSDGIISALDEATGKLIWSQTGLHARQLSAPAVMQDYVVVGDAEGYLHVLSKVDGHFMGRILMDHQGIKIQPKLYQDKLIVVGQGGQLAAVSLQE